MNKYWNTFDELVNLLNRRDKNEIANQVEKVKMYANGLTDGWHDQLAGLNQLTMNYKLTLSTDELDKLNYLKEELAKALNK